MIEATVATVYATFTIFPFSAGVVHFANYCNADRDIFRRVVIAKRLIIAFNACSFLFFISVAYALYKYSERSDELNCRLRMSAFLVAYTLEELLTQFVLVSRAKMIDSNGILRKPTNILYLMSLVGTFPSLGTAIFVQLNGDAGCTAFFNRPSYLISYAFYKVINSLLTLHAFSYLLRFGLRRPESFRLARGLTIRAVIGTCTVCMAAIGWALILSLINVKEICSATLALSGVQAFINFLSINILWPLKYYGVSATFLLSAVIGKTCPSFLARKSVSSRDIKSSQNLGNYRIENSMFSARATTGSSRLTNLRAGMEEEEKKIEESVPAKERAGMEEEEPKIKEPLPTEIKVREKIDSNNGADDLHDLYVTDISPSIIVFVQKESE
mmetsp:Transcript_12311/g.18361  ORF Transcript_12311/g.18361 Transcript_12311/m.18361 type:complete len:385 (-) Transcript_12311:89-1243(-)